MKLKVLLLVWAALLLVCAEKQQYQWDEHGYVLYCPCMGRFGNQAAHFLGALNFSMSLNRTFVIPPFRSYVLNRNVPFTEWFELEPLQSFYKSIPMEDFLSQFGPTHWPPENRTGYCYQPSRMRFEDDCDMKHGNPFGPFWNELGVDFIRSEFTHIGYDLYVDQVRKNWETKYPPDLHPVIALKGAPARFPVLREHRNLQAVFRWNQRKLTEAEEYINNTIGEKPYLAIHLRMGIDWERACESAVGRWSFMESDQCMEELPHSATITADLCLPSMQLVRHEVLEALRRTRIKSVFVASDVPAEVYNLQQYIGRNYGIYYLNPDLPQIDLIVMSRADYFIGNCVSSFSAFVKRERDLTGKPSEFFAFQKLKDDFYRQRDEL